MFGRKTAPKTSSLTEKEVQDHLVALCEEIGLKYECDEDGDVVLAFDGDDEGFFEKIRVSVWVDKTKSGVIRVHFYSRSTLSEEDSPVNYPLFLECLNKTQSLIFAGSIYIDEREDGDTLAYEFCTKYFEDVFTTTWFDRVLNAAVNSVISYFVPLFHVMRGDIHSYREFVSTIEE